MWTKRPSSQKLGAWVMVQCWRAGLALSIIKYHLLTCPQPHHCGPKPRFQREGICHARVSKRRGRALVDLPWGSENITEQVQQHWCQLPWPNKRTVNPGYWALSVPLPTLVALAESQRRWGTNDARYVKVERILFTHSFIHSLCGGDSELSMYSVPPLL